jgi:hypothetical protein
MRAAAPVRAHAKAPSPRVLREPVRSHAKSPSLRVLREPEDAGAAPTGSSATATTPAPAPTRACGPAIDSQLTDVLTRIQRDFRDPSVSGWAKELACDNLVVPTPAAIMSWDITDLFLPNTSWLRAGRCGVPRNQDDVEDPATCGNTVEVDGKCWLAGTVNYAMYGIACKLCSERHRAAIPSIIGAATDQWSRTDMRNWVRFYNMLDRKGGGIDPPLAWATATYDGGPTGRPSRAGNRDTCPTGCSGGVTPAPFDYAWPPVRGDLFH